MAFSFGFFNSKNLDRTYTAENFNDYLGSISVTGFRTTSDSVSSCLQAN